MSRIIFPSNARAPRQRVPAAREPLGEHRCKRHRINTCENLVEHAVRGHIVKRLGSFFQRQPEFPALFGLQSSGKARDLTDLSDSAPPRHEHKGQQTPHSEVRVFPPRALNPAQGLGMALAMRSAQGHFATGEIYHGLRLLGAKTGSSGQGSCLGAKLFHPKTLRHAVWNIIIRACPPAASAHSRRRRPTAGLVAGALEGLRISEALVNEWFVFKEMFPL